MRQLFSNIRSSFWFVPLLVVTDSIAISMTLVALTLASSQYTSRILRNFMRSGVTQGTLWIFAGIFTYCLIVLRSIRGGEAEFVPSLAVLFAFALALGGVVVLIFFNWGIHLTKPGHRSCDSRDFFPLNVGE